MRNVLFTGLVTNIGTVVTITGNDDITITIQVDITDWEIGESVAINGCCLTVVAIDQNIVTFNLSQTTLNTTNFQETISGDQVNLERALTLQQRLGGHFVTGHIDQKATIQSITPHGASYLLTIGPITKTNLAYCVPKGCICINGVSLTIAAISGNNIEVCIIPHTWHATNFNSYQVGTTVNLEFDYLAKIVMQNQKSARTI